MIDLKSPRQLWMLLFSLSFVAGCGEEKLNDRRSEMQDLIENVAERAREDKPGFLVLVQNAPLLAYDANMNLDLDFLSHVDGFTGEVVFYKGDPISDRNKVELLDGLPDSEWVLVLDSLNSEADRVPYMDSCSQHGWKGYPRIAPTYGYSVIPSTTPSSNANPIETLAAAQNALVAYNPPSFDKQELLGQLGGTNFDILVIDPGSKEDPLDSNDVQTLKQKPMGGSRLVLAYLNLGAAENWRYYFDHRWNAYRPTWFRGKMRDFPTEYYVKYWSQAWHEIMYSGSDPYIARITEAGFDGVLLDNVDAFAF